MSHEDNQYVIKDYKLNFKLIKSLKYLIIFLLTMILCFCFIKFHVNKKV
jgi:hypothetical protein